MISYIGDFAEDDTVYIMFNTFSSNDPSASCTITNFINTDVHIHKDDGLTQRNNAAGITVSVDFDGITGSHMVKIDTSDDTVAGFWVVGHEYFVRIEGTTIDGATINSVIGQFSIQNRYTRGTDSAALAATALTDVTWTDAKAAFIDHAISTVDTNVDTLLTRVTAAVALASVCTEGRLAELDGANIPTDVANVKAETALIVADTNELQTDWVNGGRLDLLLDAIPTTAMRGTDNAALAATALTDATWTDAKAAFLDHSIATVDTNLDTLLTRITAARAGYLDNLSAGAVALAATALTDVTWTDAKAAFIDHSIATVDTNVDTLLTRVTASVALASALATAQTDLDKITGTDGVTLATLQALYAPNKVVPDVAGTAAGLHSTTDGKIDTVDTNVDSILEDTGTDGVLLAATATSAQLVDDAWDELITGSAHNTATSAGRRLLELGAYHISSGTAQAGSAHSITLDAGETAGDHIFNRNLIVIQAGTGAGQTRTIVDYNGTTKVAVIDRNWVTNPDATSEYSIIPDDTPLVANHGVATAGTSTTITISTTASAINDTYINSIIQIMAGTGAGQSQVISGYNGTTKVVTVCMTWITTPDNTSVYVILPYGVTNVCNISTEALALINTECDTALTDYDPPTRTEATADKDAIITEVNANETKIDALNDIAVADIIAGVADGSYDLQEMMRIMFAALSGKSSGGGTTTLTFRDSGDAKNRITATVNSSGDRTAMTLDTT